VRSFVPDFDVQAPGSLPAALDLLADGCRPLAGGTDIMVQLEQGRLEPRRFVGLWGIPELQGIREEAGGAISIGALVTYTGLRESRAIAERFPLLSRSAAVTGSIANQNRGTLGGNIGNASPAGDSLPVLLVYDAELELVSRRGARRVPYARFHLGYKQMDLLPDELIARIRLPAGKQAWRQYFRKVGARAAQAISKVTIACAAELEHGRIAGFRLAYGSVAPAPLRCLRTEEALIGACPGDPPASLPDETSPIDDVRSTAHYRRRVARNLLLRFLAGLA
jgi:CO/xanthine dehydrogenase FAD-binding subunit